MNLATIIGPETGATLGFIVTVMTVVCSAVWGIATMRQMLGGLRDTVNKLAMSVDKLADRIDEMEAEHAHTRERLAALEAMNHGGKP